MSINSGGTELRGPVQFISLGIGSTLLEVYTLSSIVAYICTYATTCCLQSQAYCCNYGTINAASRGGSSLPGKSFPSHNNCESKSSSSPFNSQSTCTVTFTMILVVCRDFRLSPWFCVTAVKISVLCVISAFERSLMYIRKSCYVKQTIRCWMPFQGHWFWYQSKARMRLPISLS